MKDSKQTEQLLNQAAAGITPDENWKHEAKDQYLKYAEVMFATQQKQSIFGSLKAFFAGTPLQAGLSALLIVLSGAAFMVSTTPQPEHPVGVPSEPAWTAEGNQTEDELKSNAELAIAQVEALLDSEQGGVTSNEAQQELDAAKKAYDEGDFDIALAFAGGAFDRINLMLAGEPTPVDLTRPQVTRQNVKGVEIQATDDEAPADDSDTTTPVPSDKPANGGTGIAGVDDPEAEEDFKQNRLRN